MKNKRISNDDKYNHNNKDQRIYARYPDEEYINENHYNNYHNKDRNLKLNKR